VPSPLVTSTLLTALAQFDLSGHDEQSIREQWIYPLLGALGLRVGTMNRVDIPVKLELRPPMRALGHARFEIDYRPTVLGVGLWIIEAKRPDSDVSDDRHLGQAWTYATDPRIDVPLIVLANGTRLRVHDLTAVDWDLPVVDIAQSELAVRFTELEAVLGARRVADFVRRRQLRPLRTALSAQVDESALEQTLADVRAIVDETRALVIQNRDRIYYATRDEIKAKRAANAKAIGVWGIAFAANSPYVIPTGRSGRARACSARLRPVIVAGYSRTLRSRLALETRRE
jgi:hypothetical protein